MAEVFDKRGDTRLGYIDAEPICGEAFCDECMCCLHCDADCCAIRGEGTCRWIVYADSMDDAYAQLREQGYELPAPATEPRADGR